MRSDSASGRRRRRLWRGWMVALALVGAASGRLSAHPKTDLIVLTNGNHIECEVKSLQNGIMSVGTDAAGTISVKWTHIASVTSKYDYQVEVTSGDRYYGSLAATDKAGRLAVVNPSGTQNLELAEVVWIAPIEHGFWKRIDGSFNLGFSYTQSNQALQYSFSGDTHIRTRKRYEQLQWNSIYNTQEGGVSASQQSVSFRHSQFVGKKLSAIAGASVESNPAQGYDLRGTIGGGAGRFLVRKNTEELVAVTGLTYVREDVTDSSQVDNSAAVLLGIDFGSYSYDHPKRTITAALNTFTNVTETPRFRAQLNLKLSWEIVNNFDVSLNVYDSYDSNPPTADAASNDLSITTSIGYSF